MNLLMLTEAIASTALEHPDDHDCDTCKAAHGDRDALIRVIAEVLLSTEEGEG